MQVTWEDQQRINSYGRNAARKREIEEELEALEEELRTLEDAASEMTLADEPPRLRIGDCFVEVEVEEAEAALEKQQAEAKGRQQALMDEMADIGRTLALLRVELQQKFGDAIALDAGP